MPLVLTRNHGQTICFQDDKGRHIGDLTVIIRNYRVSLASNNIDIRPIVDKPNQFYVADYGTLLVKPTKPHQVKMSISVREEVKIVRKEIEQGSRINRIPAFN